MSILITGGASGLGKAITCRLAASQNETVYFTYCKNKEAAEALEKEFENAKGIKCDFRIEEEVNSLCVLIAGMELSVLINNAFPGSIEQQHFHKTDVAIFKENFMVNILPVIQITQCAIKAFRKKKFGKIITILTSYLANKPPVGLSGYVAEKAYLQSLVKSWAAENIKYNITSNGISPSFLRTALNADTDERIIESMAAEHPLKKLLTVEETAEAVEFLTKASNQINGINLYLNAGSNVI